MPKPKDGQGIPPVTITFFSTGLYTRRSQLFAPFKSIGNNVVSYHDALIDGQDMEVTDLLEIQRRPGYPAYCAALIEVGERVLQYYSFRTLEGTVLPFFDSNFRWAQFNASTITTLLTKTTTNQGFPATVGNMTYYTDGKDFVKLDQFGNVTPWGLPAPTATPAVTGRGFWQPNTLFPIDTSILDINGNVESSAVTGASGTTEPQWSTIIGATANEGLSLKWQNLGPILTWYPLTNYTNGLNSISTPVVILDSNGDLEVLYSATVVDAWDVGTTYAQGDYAYYGGQFWIANVAGAGQVPGSFTTTTPNWTIVPNPIQTGSTAPTWPTLLSTVVGDGQVQWKNIGPGNILAAAGYQYVYAIRTIYGDLSTASPVSINTGPILGPQPASITHWTIFSAVVTFTGINNFSAGDVFTVTGLLAGSFMNGNTFTVLSSGLSGTQFASHLAAGDNSSTDAGTTISQVAQIVGPGLTNPLCNSSALITQIQITGNIVTATANNNFTAGLFFNLFGVGTATFLAPGAVNQYQVLFATPTEFKFQFVHADYGPLPDTGLATFEAIEIYRTADGGGLYYGCGAVVNPGASSFWTFHDFVPDSGLFTEMIAPLAHANDPPPNAPGSLYPGNTPGVVHGLAWWQGRLWVAIDNYVYFSAGPDCLNGDPYSTFPPTYTFKFPGPVLGIVPTDNGMMVWLADRCALILGGPQTSTFYSWDFLDRTGVSSPNCLAKDGQNIWVYTTQKQLRRFDGGQDLNEGIYIADILGSLFDPSQSYITAHRQGLDEGVFICNGTDSILRLGVNIPCWSPIAKPVGGAGAMRSIETAVGVYSLMLGQPQP